MKIQRILKILFFALLNTLPLNSQNSFNPEGKWLGNLRVSKTLSLRIGIEVRRNERNEVYSVMHSLDQGAFDIPVKSNIFKGDSVFLDINSLDAVYTGRFKDSLHIVGFFRQGEGDFINLDLTRVRHFSVEKPARPQEPKRPYPYDEEMVKIKNEKAGDVVLSGTLTIPPGEGPFPAVILISGSGPNDRDASIFGHKVFLVLADYLTRNGIAVLRTDDRGTNESTGDYNSADITALACDVVACFHYLKDHDRIDAEKIGILGHSHGASIAPVAAVNESGIAFAVLMAGSAESPTENVIEQTEIIYKQMGVSDEGIALNTKYLETVFELVQQDTDIEKVKEQFEVFRKEFEKELSGISEEDLKTLELIPPLSDGIIDEFMTPAMRKDLFFRSSEYLSRMDCPTLVIHGDKDVQVHVRHLYLTGELIRSNGNQNVTIHEFKNKNHLFQTSETGDVREYKKIEETMAPDVQEFLVHWILNFDED